MMNTLDNLVIQKRLSCEDSDCSYQLKLKRYREQRKNLGELNRLASFQPRPVINVEEVQKKFEQIEDVPILKTDDSWRGHDDWFHKLGEEELSSSGDSSQDDEWFELSKKRMFENDDINYIKRLRTANLEELEQERQTNYDNWENLHERFMNDWREDRERVEKQRSKKTIEASLKEFEELKKSANKRDAKNVIRASMEEFEQMKKLANRRDAEDVIRVSVEEFEQMKESERDALLKQMERELMELDTPLDDETMEDFTEEYFSRQRDDIGRLEELR